MAPELTVRAIATGMALGGLLSLSNVYVGLKIGWSFGVSIAAGVLSFAVWARVARFGGRPGTIGESNMAQTCAGAAGYMASSGLNSAIPALAMLETAGTARHVELRIVPLASWITAISLVGIFTAAALKRRFVDEEKLAFPSGAACAQSLRAMYGAGGTATRARALIWAASLAGLVKLIVDTRGLTRFLPKVEGWPLGALAAISSRVSLPLRLGRFTVADYSIGMPTTLLLYGAGAIIGLRVGATMAAGALVHYVVVAPWLESHGVLRVFPAPTSGAGDAATLAWTAFVQSSTREHAIAVPSASGLGTAMRTRWGLWPGTALLVGSGLTMLCFRAPTFARAMAGAIRAMAARTSVRRPHDDHVPAWWCLVGIAASGGACVVLASGLFSVDLWIACVAVLVSVLLAAVSARATGETDIAPGGALGKLAQLLFAAIAPRDLATNLLTANITGGAAAHASELLTDLKTGHLLGTSARRQLIAQFFGVAAGTLVCVPAYAILTRGGSLGSPELPAPAAAAWRGTAELLASGATALPSFALAASVAGLALGVVLSSLEELAPRARRCLPSATGLGMAFVLDASDSLAIFAGALAAFVVARNRPAWHAQNTMLSASGIFVGEGLMGVSTALLGAWGILR